MHLDILPVCATIVSTPSKDIYELAVGIYVGTLNRCAILLGEGSSADAVYGPVVYDLTLLEGLETHTVGVEGFEY